MKFCQECGGLITSFPIDKKDANIYGCSRCGLVFIHTFEGVFHTDKGVKRVDGVGFNELMAAYREVDPNFGDPEKLGKMTDADVITFYLKFQCLKAKLVKLPSFLALALIPEDND